MQKIVFTITITVISRVFILRDWLLGRLRRHALAPESGVLVSRHSISSGSRCLDAVYVKPAGRPQAALLICHGIGEIVDHWLSAQTLLAASGIASLVFDYSGYGKSRGAIEWRRCEENAVDAFTFLQAVTPATPTSILGFSMGSGIAVAILHRVPAAQLILGSAFTSFREAACVLGLPRALSSILPDIWCSRESLPHSTVPVLILHCERDRAFPVRMASQLASLCGANAEFVVLPGQAHNEPFNRPQMSYWGHVIGRLVPQECRNSTAESEPL